jgi:uncharacterized membrane protein YgcG
MIAKRGDSEMRKSTSRLFFVLIAVAGLLVSQVFADLGLANLAAQPQGAQAVGQTVLAAAKEIYANNTDPAVIQQKLIPILNEAAATENAAAIRYTIVAALMAGGLENLTLGKTAINNSDVFANYPAWTAATVAAVEALMKASGGAGDDKSGGDKSGGDKGGGDKALGGGDKALGGGDKELGGGDTTWFPFWDSFPSDNDLQATRI